MEQTNIRSRTERFTPGETELFMWVHAWHEIMFGTKGNDLGPKQKRPPLCFNFSYSYLFSSSLFCIWTLSALRSMRSKVLQFDKLTGVNSPMILSPSFMSVLWVLQHHQRVEVGGAFTHVSFKLYARFSLMRYHWIPWIKTNSTFNGANFRLYRFSVIPGFIKKPLKAYSSYNFGQIFFKITRDDLQTKPHKKQRIEFWSSQPFVRYSHSNSAEKPPTRKWSNM